MSTQLNKLLLSNRNLIFKDGRSVSFEQKLRLKCKDFVVERSDFVLPGSKNSFRGRHFKKRYVSIRFPKIFSIRLRVPLVLSKILRTLLTTKSTLSTTYPTSITACTHSFHETMWLLTDLLSFSRKSLLKND